MNFKGKKLLVIGGAFQHCKLVEAAHEMGAIVYVVDYLSVEKAPAKQIADKHFEYNITDIDDIVTMCKEEHIDGVVSAYLDACQLPYQQVCEKLGVPCFGTKEQFHILTDKTAFIDFCIKNGVDVIPQYAEDDLKNGTAEYPVFIKPCDSRGSRGQSVCQNYEEAVKAIEFAKSESASGKVVIEKYMGGKQDFSMSYLFADGEAHLVRTGDRYLGAKKDGMDKSSVFSYSPSDFTVQYLSGSDKKVVNMLKNLGIKNGPVFFQGFIDDDIVRVYDPGLRFPGAEYDRCYNSANDTDICKALVEFALTDRITYVPADNSALLNGKCAANLFVVVRPGTIAEIKGLEEVRADRSVICVADKYRVGSVVGDYRNVRQRYGEIDLLCNSREEMAEKVECIYKTLQILDENGEDMKISIFDTELLKEKK